MPMRRPPCSQRPFSRPSIPEGRKDHRPSVLQTLEHASLLAHHHPYQKPLPRRRAHHQREERPSRLHPRSHLTYGTSYKSYLRAQVQFPSYSVFFAITEAAGVDVFSANYP